MQMMELAMPLMVEKVELEQARQEAFLLGGHHGS